MLGSVTVRGQELPSGNLLDMVHHLSDQALRFPREKAYLQIDKPYCFSGDTLWFKAYVFDAPSLEGTSRSGLLYVEVADDRGRVMKRIMVPLVLGTGRGYLPVDEKDFPAGNYVISAYTNWMRNFGPACVFQRRFSVRNYTAGHWLVRAHFRSGPGKNGRLEDTARLTFTELSGKPVSFRNLEVTLADSGKVLHKNTFRSGVDGGLTFQFSIPGKADPGSLELRIRDMGPGQTAPALTVPVMTRSLAQGDLQFMAEGGILLAGVRNKVAFKALGSAGEGIPVSGTVYDDRDSAVATFSASHLGMGSFYLTPLAGARYRASVPLAEGKTLSFPLPLVHQTGAVLQVSDPLGGDSVAIRVVRAAEAGSPPEHYFLVGVSRGIGCFGAMLALGEGAQTVMISKRVFPTGITRLILLDRDRKPVCRRLVYIDRHDQLRAAVRILRESSDSITAELTVRDSAENPVAGSFSVAVTDEASVRVDTLQRPSLASSLLLSSDLKGWVEAPGYYFQQPLSEKAWHDLDNLLLTQGWAAYAPDTTAQGKARYPPETSFSVSGKITNIFNKPVAGSQVLLFGSKPVEVKMEPADSVGGFTFRNLYPLDTASYMLQARNKRGRSFNVGITVDAFTPPVFTTIGVPSEPWYVDLDIQSLAGVRRHVEDREALDKLLGKHVLHEVVVVGQKVIAGSKNLNGPGGSDFALSESDMQKAGKMALREILERDVKGFHLGGKRLNVYLINTSLVHLIIDGVNLDFFHPSGTSQKDFYDPYLNYLTAEDIKGIEVMTSSRYTGAYFQKFIDPLSSPFEHVFIEITTYSGNGAFLKKTPGVYLYRPPLAFERPARFYQPGRPPDARIARLFHPMTVYWEPDILTGKDGKARFSFRTNGSGRYLLILEGADMQGGILTMDQEMRIK